MTAVVKLIFILLTGSQNPEGIENRVHEGMYDGQPIVYAQLDTTKLRAEVAKNKELQTSLYGPDGQKVAVQKALQQLANMSKVEQQDLTALTTGLQGIGLWYLALSEDEECQRILLLADFGNSDRPLRVFNMY